MTNSIVAASVIHVLRGCQVIIDRDLAQLYEVSTGALTRAVRRNAERFPDDFMFRLTKKEWDNLKCQFGISSWGGDRSLPCAFTEQGVAMLSSVLRSPRAIATNIEIMRVFVQIRRALSRDKRLGERMDRLERRVDDHGAAIISLVDVISSADEEPAHKPRRIGFELK